MKKLLIIIVVMLSWCGVGVAACIEGDCNNGQGTFTWAGGDKYVGEFKDGKQNGQGTLTFGDGTGTKAIFKKGEIVKELK